MTGTVGYLEQVFIGLIADVAKCYPSDAGSLEIARNRVSLLYAQRGVRVFTLELPACAKVLDRTLDAGFLVDDLPYFKRRARRSEWYPTVFGSLWKRIVDVHGNVLDEPDINAVAALRQLYLFGKKLAVDCADTITYKKVKEFYVRNAKYANPVEDWGVSHSGEYRPAMWPSSDVHDEGILAHPSEIPLGYVIGGAEYPIETYEADRIRFLAALRFVADVVATQLGPFDPSGWRFKHGKGAVSDLRRYANKYAFPLWSEKLELAFPYAEYGFSSYESWAEHVRNSEDPTVNGTPSSTLVAVPKDAKGPRLIAKEPTAHQWCQQAILSYFVGRVRDTVIGKTAHLDDQAKNREHAARSSHNLRHATIDLSNASDSISPRLVEWIFRRNHSLLIALFASRTEWIAQAIDKASPLFARVGMFSTMGSAVTFPLQTILYSVIACASELTRRRLPLKVANVARVASMIHVFGDDIIVPTDGYWMVEDFLSLLGFEVNADKSFAGRGGFRESCGVDAYKGYEVTPIYVRQEPNAVNPESIVSAIETSNNLHRAGWWEAAKVVAEASGRARTLPVVAIGSGVFGLQSFVGGSDDHLTVRWHRDLQKEVVFCTQVIGSQKKQPIEDETALLQYFTEDPDPTTKWKSGVGQQPTLLVKGRWVPRETIIG